MSAHERLMRQIERERRTEKAVREMDAHEIVAWVHAIEDKRDAFEARVAELEGALGLIAAMKNMTLLGSDPNPETSHQLGANKAFNQCAEIAQNALAKPTQEESA